MLPSLLQYTVNVLVKICYNCNNYELFFSFIDQKQWKQHHTFVTVKVVTKGSFILKSRSLFGCFALIIATKATEVRLQSHNLSIN